MSGGGEDVGQRVSDAEETEDDYNENKVMKRKRCAGPLVCGAIRGGQMANWGSLWIFFLL